MRTIGPSNRLPFRTIVLGTAMTALCDGDADVGARVIGAAAVGRNDGVCGPRGARTGEGVEASAWSGRTTDFYTRAFSQPARVFFRRAASECSF